MKSIISYYMEKAKVVNEREKQVCSEIKQHEFDIAKLQNQLKKLQIEKNKIIHPSWVHEVVEVLAQQLADKRKKKFMVVGPYGVRNEVTIYLMEDNRSIQNKTYWSLVVAPGDFDKGEWFYVAEEIIGEQGDLKLLPESIDEISELLVYRGD